MAASPFDHPIYGELFGDPEIAPILSAETEILTMLAFEIALAQAEAEQGVIPMTAAEAIRATLAAHPPSVVELANGTGVDAVPGPSFVRYLKAALGENGHYLHFGATSQDIGDSAMMVRLKMIVSALQGRIDLLGSSLQVLATTYGNDSLMGRTRMQAALPIAVADRIRAWWGPLSRLRGDLQNDVFVVQLGGPVGTLAELGDAAPAVRQRVAQLLDLADAPCWHTQRDRMVRIAGWLATLTGALGKLGQDIALMAQMGEIVLAGGGSSSAMPHKQNPVNAEVLVALARYNAALLPAMHQGMIHEQERSGAAWTLEWLVLPQMAMTAASATRLALRLLGQVEGMGGNG